jgi:hypothetical protein
MRQAVRPKFYVRKSPFAKYIEVINANPTKKHFVIRPLLTWYHAFRKTGLLFHFSLLFWVQHAYICQYIMHITAWRHGGSHCPLIMMTAWWSHWVSERESVGVRKRNRYHLLRRFPPSDTPGWLDHINLLL